VDYFKTTIYILEKKAKSKAVFSIILQIHLWNIESQKSSQLYFLLRFSLTLNTGATCRLRQLYNMAVKDEEYDYLFKG
jgi:hypothetical protein